jgi:4-hydroxy-3-methylbut-2-en-1-yl diphosphate reductase
LAPDDLVQALLDRLRREFGGVVETRTLVEEDVSFELPRSVRRLLVLN